MPYYIQSLRASYLMSRDLQVVVGLCDEKQRCQVPVVHDVFTEDPCPNIGKYLEVAYRCPPGTKL